MKITIEKLVYGGAGVGFVDKMPIFVPMTVPGDEIEYKIKRKHASYIEGELVRVLRPSPNRVIPKCKYFGECGGCQWQHMDYAAQILWKQLIVEEQLRRIGKIKESNVLPTIPSPKIWNYRNRVKLHKDKEGRVGFYAAGSHRIVEIDECAIAEEYPPHPSPLSPRWSSGEAGPQGERGRGEGGSFTQVNTLQNKNLQQMVVELVQKANIRSVMELYCGNGNLTLPIAKIVDEITATDSDKKAINFAIESAHRDKIENINFICQSAKIAANNSKNKKFDCVILDPPRDGCKEIISGLAQLKPKTIIYVSCNPSTLARDVRQLIDSGYSLKSTQPIDMFPQTYHIETISYLQR